MPLVFLHLNTILNALFASGWSSPCQTLETDEWIEYVRRKKLRFSRSIFAKNMKKRTEPHSKVVLIIKENEWKNNNSATEYWNSKKQAGCVTQHWIWFGLKPRRGSTFYISDDNKETNITSSHNLSRVTIWAREKNTFSGWISKSGAAWLLRNQCRVLKIALN